ncbi:Peptidase S41 family protein ustP [Colletotrichum orbiculare MAFF 240422]|uniref:Peptidase S41 family protein ustP n=1 Tax=Colletotrichum orbiculare (strain 104-T / ATCC 96160 / CBS 514.97 / LARS 414 / MAFF 240422) TaxID=1213857 RepID=N4VQG0_COLOR|nr:Peptidase S41 family protein ustP [Colletotrichum orbiculare MAFF 240422]
MISLSLLFSLLLSLLLRAVLIEAQCVDDNCPPTSRSDRDKRTSASVTDRKRSTGEPCAQVSELWAARVSEDDPYPSVEAELAYACLKSVPLHKPEAIALVDAIRPYLEWQSTLAFLKNPPAGYEPAPFDLMGHLQSVRDKLVANVYAGEIEFQEDLFQMTAKARDGHFAFRPDALTKVFQFGRPFALVSYAKDPLSTPAIKVLDEVKADGDNAKTVSRINGVDASVYVERLVNQASAAPDMDAAYNSMFYSTAVEEFGLAGEFQFLGWDFQYPGEKTTIEYAEGGARSAPNFAAVTVPFADITDGEAFYQRFCAVGAADVPRAPHVPLPASMGTSLQSGDRPVPVVTSCDYAVRGYFLDGDGYEDVAVLRIFMFPMGKGSFQRFQNAMDDFLEACKADGKSKVIIDLRINQGGHIYQGYELFRQFFPHIEPDLFTRWRAHRGSMLLAKHDSAISEGDGAGSGAARYSPWSYLSDLNTTYQPFTSFKAKFGPRMWNGDSFTELIKWNLDSPYLDAGLGASLTGYGNRRNFKQPLESRDIILLTDGSCASTCSVFASLMETQGNVKTVVIGGRPNGKPMQGAGGTKGHRTMSFDVLRNTVQVVMQKEAQTSGQKDPEWQLTDLPLIRSTDAALNMVDQIRRADFETGIPAQFINEPAACRLYWTLGMLKDVTEIWKAAAGSAWNGAGCVAGAGFGGARLRVPLQRRSAGPAERSNTKVISADDSGSGSCPRADWRMKEAFEL